MSDKLNLLDQFPDVVLTTTSEEQIRVPADLQSDYALVLFYRGHW